MPDTVTGKYIRAGSASSGCMALSSASGSARQQEIVRKSCTKSDFVPKIGVNCILVAGWRQICSTCMVVMRKRVRIVNVLRPTAAELAMGPPSFRNREIKS